MEKERIFYADLLRTAAVFTVVLVHVATYRMYGIAVDSYEWQVFNIYNSLGRCCVPIFVMLSGMFLLDPEKTVRTSDLYAKHIFRILCALVFWGMAYNYIPFAIDYLVQHEPRDLHDLAVFPRLLLFGPPWYHLWFLYSIIGLYMITPLLRVFVEHAERKDLEYLLVLFLLFGNAIPLANIFLGRIDETFVINAAIPELGGYAGHFIAGHYFATYGLDRGKRFILYALGAVSLASTVLVSATLSATGGSTDTSLYGLLLPNTLFPAFAVFVLFKNVFTAVPKNKKCAAPAAYLSGCAFGIYLVHDYFNSFFSAMEISTLAFNPIFSVPLISLAIFGLSLLSVSLIRRVPLIGSYIT